MGFFLQDLQADRTKRNKTHGVSDETLARLGCRACPLKQHDEVGPHGSRKAPVYVLGSAPTPRDAKRGRLFVGPAQRLLRNALPMDNDDDLRYGTVVRRVTEEEPSHIAMQCCRPKVEADIEAAKPKVIIGMGVPALKWASKQSSLFLWRGRRFPIKVGDHTCWFAPTYDPAVVYGMRRDDRPAEEEKQFGRDVSHAVANYEVWPDPVVHDKDDWWQGVTIISGKRGTADLKLLERRIDEICDDTNIGLDLETNGLRPYKKDFKILTASISNGDDTIAFPLDHKDGWPTQKHRRQAHKIFLKFLRNKCHKVTQKLSFEMEVLCVYYNDLKLSRDVKWHDTLAQAYILDGRKGMNDLDTLVFLQYGFWLKDIFSGLDKGNLENADLDTVLRYNALDAKYTKLLFSAQELEVENTRMTQVYKDQMRRIPTVVLTQIKGLPVDQSVVEKWNKRLTKQIEKSLRLVNAMPVVAKFEKEQGRKFRPSSPDDLGIMLKKYIPSEITLTSSGKVSTNAATLEKLEHPLGRAVLQYRQLTKLKSTYNDSIMLPDGQDIWPDGRIHPQFNHALTETRRLSSSGPNAQNYPKRKNADIREQIKAEEGWWLLSVDYGQIEYRVIAMLSKDRAVVQALWENYDVHMEWFEKIAYRYPVWVGGKKFIKDPDIRKQFRNKAKNEWVFPLFFGASFNSVAKYLGIDPNILRPVYDEFWDTFEGVKKWQRDVIRQYEQIGYVENVLGFRRRAPIQYNQIINTPVQSSASEIVIDGMNRLSERAMAEGNWNLQPIINIHDDLTFELPDDHLEENLEAIIDEMLGCDFDFLNVPLVAEATIGRDWYNQEEVGVYRSDEWFA